MTVEMSNETIVSIRNHALELLNMKNSAAELTNQLDQLARQIREKEEKIIPDLMDELDMEKVSFSDMDISKTVKYRSSVTKANQDEAFKYLTDSGNEGVIKETITIDVKNNPDIIEILNEHSVLYDHAQSVHHATLSKVITGLVEEGKLSSEDFATFSIYAQPVLKIKVK